VEELQGEKVAEGYIALTFSVEHVGSSECKSSTFESIGPSIPGGDAVNFITISSPTEFGTIEEKPIGLWVVFVSRSAQEKVWFHNVGASVFGAPDVALAAFIAEIDDVADLVLFLDD